MIFRKVKFGTEKLLAKSARTYNMTDVNIKYKYKWFSNLTSIRKMDFFHTMYINHAPLSLF